MSSEVTPTVVVEDIAAVSYDGNTGDLTLGVRSQGTDQTIVIHRSQMAALIAALTGMPDVKRNVGLDQVLVPQRVQAFQVGSATGLMLFLAGGWLLPVALPAECHSAVRDMLLLAAQGPQTHQ
jgi:hypothetical protein